MKSAKRFVIPVLLVLVMSLVSCGKAGYSFIYNNLGFFIHYKLNQTLKLSPAQSAFFKERFARHLEWHRSTALPNYIAGLKELKKRRMAFSAKDATWITNWVMDQQKELLVRIRDDTAEFLTMMDERQIAIIQAKMDAGHKKIEEEMKKDPEKRHSERTAFIVKMVELLHGSLTSDQKDTIHVMDANLSDTTATQLEIRRTFFDEFQGLMERKASKEELKKNLIKWFTGFMTMITDNQRKDIEKSMNEYNALVVAIDQKVLTPEQKQNSLKKIDEYIAILTYIRNGK